MTITKENIEKYFDKTINTHIPKIFNLCQPNMYKELILYIKMLNNEGNSNMDILHVFINYINKYNKSINKEILLSEENKIDIYEILSYGNIILNELFFIQLCDIITKLYNYICDKKIKLIYVHKSIQNYIINIFILFQTII